MAQQATLKEDIFDKPKSFAKFPIRNKPLQVDTINNMQQVVLEQHQTKKFNQRDRIDIFAQILEMLSYQKRKEKIDRYIRIHNRNGEFVSLRKIKHTIGIASKNFAKHIKYLKDARLIDIDTFEGRTKHSKRKTTKTTWKVPRLTEKGILFLRVYRNLRDLIA